MTMTIETRIVRTAPGMDFDVSVAGDPNRPLVLMLHGFCVSRHYWDAQAVALAEAGYFAAAPNQRGYAPGARPDPAEHANYTIDVLIGDAMAIVAGLGHGERRFHLAGHNWGGSHRRSLARAVGLANHAVASASAGVQPRPAGGPGAADALRSSQMAAGSLG